MKARKRILATLLSIAVAATTVLPGTLTVSAASIVTETAGQGVETQTTWSEAMEKKNVGGEFYWHLQSSATTNNNVNNDYSAETAPAIILDYDKDLTFNGEPSTICVDIYPNGTLSSMRFGIMLKYAGPTNWAYLYYDGGWGFEYNYDGCTDGQKWGTVSGIPSLVDNQDRTVKITYVSASEVQVSVISGEEESEPVSIERDALAAVEEWAKTAGEDGSAIPVHFGFKAGTYSGTITDVNLKNMSLNGEDVMNDNWDWVVSRDGQVFTPDDVIGGTNYAVLNGKTSSYSGLEDFANGTVSAVVRPVTDNAKFALAAKYTDAGSVQVGYDGSRWYYTVGTAKTQANANLAVEKDKDYQINMTIDDGKLSANVALAEEGAAEQAVASNVDVSGVAAGKIAVSAEAGTELWIRNVNYNKVVKSEPTDLIAKYDELAASIGTANTDNKYYSDLWSAYETALNEAKTMIDSNDNITQAEANAKQTAMERAATRLEAVDKTALEARYNEYKDTQNLNYTDDTWAAFSSALQDAQEVIKKIDAKQSIAKAEVTAASNNIANTARRLIQKMATEEEKAALTTLYNEIKALNSSAYTADTWAAAAAALTDAEAALAMGDGLSQYELQAATKALQDAKAALKLAYTVSFIDTAYTVDATATVETKVNANTTVTYTSSDPSVATVDANGVVTGVKAGTATITATAGTVSATATVTVTTPKVTLNAKTAKLQIRKNTTAIKVASKIDTDSVVSWSSSKPNIASVTKNGKVTAKKTGKTVLTVTMKSGATASCTLNVQKGKVKVSSIKANVKKVSLKKGKKFTIEVTKNPITVTDKVTYSTNKKKVATVSNKGVITAKGKGKCKVTVKCGGKKATINVTVK